ncbi:MAG: tetratricopeptide repeat protein [Phycisphaerales bacterium JB040]
MRRTLAHAGVLLIAAAACSDARAQATEFILDETSPGADPWSVAQVAPPGSDAAELAEARRLIAENRPDRAKALLDDWIERNAGTGSPHLAEAYLLRGDALLADKREYQALYDYETVIKDFPASNEFITAVAREYDIGAAYLGGLKRKIFGLRIERSDIVGEELLIRAQERVPGSELAERSAITLADYYYDKRDLELAQEMYAIFVNNFPDSVHRRRAALRQIFCAIARFKGPDYDASTLIDARLLILDYRARYPGEAQAAGITEALLNRIDESAAQQMLRTAQWYLKQGNEPSARFTMLRLLRKHPASTASRTAVDIMDQRGWLEPREDPTPPAQADTGAES